jgi:hypothetical protein
MSESGKPSKTKKKPVKKAAPKAAVSQFAGLTKTACADGCNAKGCVISGKPYCAHPTKGALQTGDMNNAGALKRLRDAREYLGVRVDPNRFKD